MEHTLAAEATAAERDAVDGVLDGAGPASAPSLRDPASRLDADPLDHRRDLLLPALHALQSRRGWISRGGLGYVCERLSVAPADAYGVASFYGLFSLEPAPPRVVH